MRRANVLALALLILGSAQMAGDLLGWPALKGLGAASMISPAPKVFSAVRGLETYSTRFFLEWTDVEGHDHELELTPETYARLRGPYNRRNVYGAALAYGPVLALDEHTRPMLDAVLRYGLCGEAPILRELGLDPARVTWPVHLRFEALPGTDLGELEARLEVPLP